MAVLTFIAICAAVLLVAAGTLTFYLIRVLQSLRHILETSREILQNTQPRVKGILEDVSDSTSSVRDVVVRVDRIISGMISIPDLAKTFAKQTLTALLSKEKRGS